MELLFLRTLFEGVPKFCRDCFEQGVLDASRTELLRKMFFQSSSPLRHEADNWFLHELRGRYDVALEHLARHPGCSHGDLQHHVSEVSGEVFLTTHKDLRNAPRPLERPHQHHADTPRADHR